MLFEKSSSKSYKQQIIIRRFQQEPFDFIVSSPSTQKQINLNSYVSEHKGILEKERKTMI